MVATERVHEMVCCNCKSKVARHCQGRCLTCYKYLCRFGQERPRPLYRTMGVRPSSGDAEIAAHRWPRLTRSSPESPGSRNKAPSKKFITRVNVGGSRDAFKFSYLSPGR